MSPRPTTDDTREKLIEAAMELFTFQGYAATGLAQIARKAKVLPGSLYYFFPTKADLLHATLERRHELLQSAVLDPVWQGVADPIERVFALLAGYRQMLTMTDFQHGCPIGNLVIEVGNTHPDARRLLVRNFDNWLDAVERCYRDALPRLPHGQDPRQLAVYTLVTMEGAVMLARAYRSFEAYDAAVVQLRDHVERLLVEAEAHPRPVKERHATKRARRA
ncbi:MAG: TetR/AcrR family transcriptional regulator [Planctomycetes bacterium]|nr:TetR/AcrR family transcriptional regulator [Planctomycetota bacterium]